MISLVIGPAVIGPAVIDPAVLPSLVLPSLVIRKREEVIGHQEEGRSQA
jgi:hypothetical protein